MCLCRCGFSTWFRHRRTGTRHRPARWQNLWRRRHAPLDSSDDRLAGLTHRGHGHKLTFTPQTIDQLLFFWAQHLLRQRREVSENPKQIRSLFEVGLNISRPDRRIDLQDAVCEFFDPHGLAYLDDTVRIAFPERVIITPAVEGWEEIFHPHAHPSSLHNRMFAPLPFRLRRFLS